MAAVVNPIVLPANFHYVPPPSLMTKIAVGEEGVEVDKLPETVAQRTFFYITDKLFAEIQATRYANPFRCTSEEVSFMNNMLKTKELGIPDFTIEDFRFETDVRCPR